VWATRPMPRPVAGFRAPAVPMPRDRPRYWQARLRPARAPRLGAMAQRVAVRTSTSSSAADHVVAVARLCTGRSDPEPRHAGRRRRRRARAAARSDAGPEGLARRCAGRREQAQSRARGAGRQPQDKIAQCKPVELPKPPPPPPPPVQVASRRAASSRPPHRRAAAPPINRPPPGQLPCNWSGASGGEGVTRNKHYLGDRPGFVAITTISMKPERHQSVYRGQVLGRTGGTQRAAAASLRLEAGRRGLFGRRRP